MNRRGLILPGVLLVAVVLALLAATRLFFSREQLHLTQRLAEREAACHLAEGGLAVGRRLADDLLAFLDDPDPATFPKADRAPEPIRPLVSALLDPSGRLKPGAGPVALESPAFRPLLSASGGGATLRVTVELGESTPLYAGAPGQGFLPDPREASLPLLVRAEATRNGVPYRFVAVRPLKTVSTLVPALGKFTLMLRRPGTLRLAGLLDSDDPGKLREEPLVLHHGETVPAGTLAPEALRDLIDRQGWVALGGDAPWTLPLSKGGGRPDLEEGLLRKERRLHPIPAGGPLSAIPDLSFFSAEECLHRELSSPERGASFALLPAAQVAMSSLLNLAGAEGALSPTLALGDIRRRFALLQGLANEANDEWATLPYLTAAAFAGDDWPGGHAPATVAAIRAQFGGKYESYAQRMCAPVETPWNLANLRMLRLAADAADAAAVDPAAPPPGFTPPPPSQRLFLDNMAAPPHAPAAGGRHRLLDTAGRVLYDGPPLAAVDDLAFLAVRAGVTFPDAAAFARAAARAGGFTAFGCALIEGPLAIDRPVEVGPRRGGLLLVRGDIRVAAPVRCAPGETLALVSLTGNLEVETAATVEALLVAPAGRATLRGPVALVGGLIARDLELPKPAAPEPRRLAYDRAHDPTDAENAARRYRHLAGPVWRIYVE